MSSEPRVFNGVAFCSSLFYRVHLQLVFMAPQRLFVCLFYLKNGGLLEVLQ
jgi:hypothetical protein